MDNKFSASREIGIDAGHRVTNHNSKCRNVHGHRYTVIASYVGDVSAVPRSSSEGMVMDFSFMKDDMMAVIDAPCDHGLILWEKDPLVSTVLAGHDTWKMYRGRTTEGLLYLNPDAPFGKVYIVNFVPTAENLAKHWCELLRERLQLTTLNVTVHVWETPFCSAVYPA